MTELSANVYENKGPAFSSPARTGNVVENKGSYASRAGMLLKRQVVSRWQVRRESQKWQAESRRRNNATSLSNTGLSSP